MNSGEKSHPKVFISYSHDSAEHADRVLVLSDRLRADGIDCILDQYEVSPSEGFPRWMDRQIRTADFVLMICTPTYYRRVMGEEEPGKGLGVSWESNEIYQYIYDTGTSNARFIPVLPEGGSNLDIPIPWRGVKYYRVFTEEGYEELYRRLTNQPYTPKPELGKMRQLPARQRQYQFVETMANEHTLNPVASVSSAAETTVVGSVPVPTWNIPSVIQEKDAAPIQIWTVPFRRNPLFTGRENILTNLHNILTSSTATLKLPQVISGLGGIGKTQLAVEYTYRYRKEYQTVLWAEADSSETLTVAFNSFAGLLYPFGRREQDQKYIVDAVKGWLEANTNWLLILDNVEDHKLVYQYLPLIPRGDILITSRTPVAGGIAHVIELEKMDSEEGALFLLHRAKLITPDASPDKLDAPDLTKAKEIVEILDGLPLALDQAGAYIDEIGCGLSGYLELYEQRHSELLKKRGGIIINHPEPVATTWSLSFEKIEKASRAAAELMKFFSFLHPDSIPEELIIRGASHLSPLLRVLETEPFVLKELIGELYKYSLIRRNSDETTLRLHRLVQAVLKDSMDKPTQRQWAEQTVLAVNQAFPKVEFTTWQECQRLLAQAQQCATLIERWQMIFPEAARLLDEAGYYLYEHAQYVEAESFLNKARAIREQTLGPQHFDMATSLNHLAELYRTQGKYEQVEPLFEQALAIQRKALGAEHPDIAITLDNLAAQLRKTKRREEAMTLEEQAREIRAKIFPLKPKTS